MAVQPDGRLSRLIKNSHNVVLILLILCIAVVCDRGIGAEIVYVDSGAPGIPENGSNWYQAFDSLQEALGVAQPGDEIHVAQGEYCPGLPGAARSSTFQLSNGVTIKGGFAGYGEPTPDQRDSYTYETILSGDLNGDDSAVSDAEQMATDANRVDNCYHVVAGTDTDSSAVLDGFVISGGDTTGLVPAIARGGGMINDAGSPTVSNCVFRYNLALRGGGIYNRNSSATIKNCLFYMNYAQWGGGLYNVEESNPTISNCTFSRNTVDEFGGGIENNTDLIININSCILWGNRDSQGNSESAQILTNQNIFVQYSCVQGWQGIMNGMSNTNKNPLFVDMDEHDYHLLSEYGRLSMQHEGLYLDKATSPCIDAGDPMLNPDQEPKPNGGRINMGVYGGTEWASLGCGPVRADVDRNGKVDLGDFAVLSEDWLTYLPWSGKPHPRLVASWCFDEMCGCFAEDMVRGKCGVLSGPPTWVDGERGGALHFAGEDYIDVGNDSYYDIDHSITIAARVKVDNVQTAWPHIISKGTAWQLALRSNTGKLYFSLAGVFVQQSGFTSLESLTDIKDGLWHHVAAIYDGDSGIISLYIDGQLDNFSPATGTITKSSESVMIGGDSSSMSLVQGWWQGMIDDVRLYNYAAPVAEIYKAVYHVDAFIGDDNDPINHDGLSRSRAYSTIGHVLYEEDIMPGDAIMVWPGVYEEELYIDIPITLASASEPAVIKAVNGFAVTFAAVQSDCTLKNFIITDSDIGILLLTDARPVIDNVTIVNNVVGLEAYDASEPSVQNCIFWDNNRDMYYQMPVAQEASYSCIEDGAAGPGNISEDPCFADPLNYDFHLKSQTRRHISADPNDPNSFCGIWVVDTATSPCIDKANPEVYPARERHQNGGRNNMGAYGNTPYSSLSCRSLPADIDQNGIVEVDDLKSITDKWLWHDPWSDP